MGKAGLDQKARNSLQTVSKVTYIQMEKFAVVVECMNLEFGGEIRPRVINPLHAKPRNWMMSPRE